RDSLRATHLAAALFESFARAIPTSLFAPKAIVAALALEPGAADSLLPVLDSAYPASPYTLALHGENSPAYAAAEDSLAQMLGVERAGAGGFGRAGAGVAVLGSLGGVVTKAVTPEPRRGHPRPRVAEFRGGMLNAVGLANPGLEAVATRELPQLAARLRRARIVVNVAGATVDDYVSVV